MHRQLSLLCSADELKHN